MLSVHTEKKSQGSNKVNSREAIINVQGELLSLNVLTKRLKKKFGNWAQVFSF